MTPTWINFDSAVAVTGWTPRWLRSKIASGEVGSREAKKSSRNGKPLREVKTSSLPQFAQAELQKQFEVRPRVVHPAQDDAQAALTPSTARVLPITAPRVALPEHQGDAQARERLDKIAPIYDYRNNERLFLEQGITLTSIVQQIAATHGISAQTVWRWDEQFRRHGLVALADRTRRDAGQSRWASQNPEAAKFVAHIYLNLRQPVSTCAAALTSQRDLFRIDHLPSYETVRSFLGNPNEVSPALKMFAREGKRKYQETCSVYLRRDYSDVRANQVWVSDHMIHDAFVQNDCFGTRDRQAIRLQLTMIVDFRSRMPVGYSWCENGSSRSISTAMRHAVGAYGACEVFYCDNGKDYQKIAKGAARAGADASTTALLRDLQLLQEQGTMARLGIQALHCLKYHPQSKHVERFFGTLHQQFDKQWPTYTGPDARDVPDETQVLWARHKTLLGEGRVHLSEMPLASEFISTCRHWIDNEYCHQPHTGQAMQGRTPREVFEQQGWIGKGQTLTPDILTALLPDTATRKVREGSVEINGQRFIAAPGDIRASAAMEHWNTRSVTVAYDPNDDAAVAHDKHGNLIAYLTREVPVGFYPLLTGAAAELAKAKVTDSLATRNAHMRSHRDSLASLAKGVSQSGARSPIEITRERAAPPTAVGDHITDKPAPRVMPRRMQSQDIADMIVAQMGGE